MDWKTEEILIIVKAYPTLSNKYGETVCTAGITREGKWIRLYPVQYRDLPKSQQYKKFQWIRARVQPSSEKLHRPESHKVDTSSIEILDHLGTNAQGWREREKLFLPHISKSLEELNEMKESEGVSLGAFKPKYVKDFVIREGEGEWELKKQAVVGQNTLFHSSKTPLEKIPYTFTYLFSCEDERCKENHDITVVDWEAGESYRNFKKMYKTEELTLTKMKEKWLDYFFRQRESYFVVGTDSEWNHFLILTVISPQRRTDQLTLGF